MVLIIVMQLNPGGSSSGATKIKPKPRTNLYRENGARNRTDNLICGTVERGALKSSSRQGKNRAFVLYTRFVLGMLGVACSTRK